MQCCCPNPACVCSEFLPARSIKPRLPAKTLKLLNAYRDHLAADVSYHAYGGHDKEFKAAVRKARRELVKHLLKP